MALITGISFCVKNFLGLLLAGLGVALVDLSAVVNALTLNYITLVGTVVVFDASQLLLSDG